MHPQTTHRRPRGPCLAAALTALALASPAAQAQTTSAPSPASNTVDLLGSVSRLTDRLPNGDALNLRLTALRGGDNLLRAELLREDRFGERGGVVGAGFQQSLSADWFMGANLTLGHGGPNWPRKRLDLSLNTKLGAQRDNIAQLAVYRALYDNQRSDRGIGLALVSYVASPLVLQAGVTYNVSDPGGVGSVMYSASGTWGQEGQQSLSLRLSTGSESYQALGVGQQLVDFNSHSVALNWRRWLGPRWGFIAQAEHYGNPSYRRLTVGAGLFSQW